MAENEYLGIGYMSSHRRTRGLIHSGSASIEEICASSTETLDRIVRRNLRRLPPLKEILDVLISDPKRLRAALADYKDQDLSRMVRNACINGSSKDPGAVASRMVDALLSDYLKETLRYACKAQTFTEPERQYELRNALTAALPSIKPRLVAAFANSLSGTKPARLPKLPVPRRPVSRSGANLSERSLIRQPAVTPHVNQGR